jgi:hypothetical protein
MRPARLASPRGYRHWLEHSYGDAFPAGSTDVAADTLIVQAYGTHPFGHSDELTLFTAPLSGMGF